MLRISTDDTLGNSDGDRRTVERSALKPDTDVP
jgi:hypothetical protein